MLAMLPKKRGCAARNAPPEGVAGPRDNVVEIARTRLLHAVVKSQDQLRRHVADSRCDRGDRDSGEVIQRALAGEYEDGTLLVRCREPIQPDVTSVYSSGHVATPSHPAKSSAFRGWRCQP